MAGLEPIPLDKKYSQCSPWTKLEATSEAVDAPYPLRWFYPAGGHLRSTS